jgi:RNA polymerase sigma-70 factor (ECF subfamily)
MTGDDSDATDQGRLPMQIDASMRDRIYGWAFRLLQSHHDALDATQDVLVKTLHARAESVTHSTAWLRRITINHCIDLIRRRKPVGALSVEPAVNVAPDAELHAAETRARIVEALANLSEQQRLVLVAKVYDGETFAAIAEAMDLAVPTIKTHYLRALGKLRAELIAHGE